MRDFPPTLDLAQLFVWICFRTPEAVRAVRPNMMPAVIEAPIDLDGARQMIDELAEKGEATFDLGEARRRIDAQDNVFARHRMLFPELNRIEGIECEVKRATNRGALPIYGLKPGGRRKEKPGAQPKKMKFPLSAAHIFCFSLNAVKDSGSGVVVWESIYVREEDCLRVWPARSPGEAAEGATNFRRKPGPKPDGVNAKAVVEGFLVAKYGARPQLSSAEVKPLAFECKRTGEGSDFGIDALVRALRLYVSKTPRGE